MWSGWSLAKSSRGCRGLFRGIAGLQTHLPEGKTGQQKVVLRGDAAGTETTGQLCQYLRLVRSRRLILSG